MGTDHTGDTRGFHHLNRAWYASACKRGGVEDEVTFGFYCPDGGTSGEMTMTFEYLGGQLTPCLKVWNDAWHTLYEFRDVLARMAEVDDEHITPAQFCAILAECGFADLTATEQGRK